MRKLNRLLMAALVLTVPLAACDEGDDTITPEPTPPAVGTVAGSVTVQGEGGIAGVTVQLAGASAASTTTGSDGSFSFANVVEGNYSVAISGIPADFTFQNTTQTVTISQDGETVPVSFSGSVVRTASISGSVSLNGAGFEGVPVTISGPDGSETKNSDPTGTFQFTGLRSGSYTVMATNPDPATYTFTSDEASFNLGVGESEVVAFSATSEVETDPAEISINAITQAGAPITLSNVMGQIEVAVNIRRNGNTLNKVEIVIDDEVVAAQQFAELSIDGPAQQDEVEIVTLNVPTTQVRVDGSGVPTPVLFNGGATVEAILYTVEGEDPIPSNEVPIVLNNPDYLIPGLTQGEMELVATTTPGANDVNGDTWNMGDFELRGPYILSYSTVVPDAVDVDTDACAFDGSAITGTPQTGLMLVNSYDCTGVEQAGIGAQNDIDDFDYGSAAEGPDGTDLDWSDEFARLGAMFELPDAPNSSSMESRRFLLTDPNTVLLPDELNIDNVSPSLFIFGNEADDPSTATAADLQVAYNDEMDQWWTQSTFAFETTVSGPDGGVEPVNNVDVTDPITGENGVGLSYFEIRVYDADADVCGGDVIARVEYTDLVAGAATYPNALDQTLTSDDTNGHILCVVGADLLGNMTAETAADESNYFGVDDTAPLVRVWGNTSNLAVADPASPSPYAPENTTAGGTAEGTTPVSADLNTTIYGATVDDPAEFRYAGASARDVSMAWGMDALDNRAGLDDLTGQPFSQTLTHSAFSPLPCTGLDTDIGGVLSDTWVRIAGTGTTLDCGLAVAGIYQWTGMVQDRAGNVAQVGPFNYIIDETTFPTVDAVTLGQSVYTPGMPGTFGIFGTDDLENIEFQTWITYPTTALGAISILNPPETIADRWDDDFALSSIGVDDNPLLTATPYGRIDFTDGSGDITTSPLAGNLPADFNAAAGASADADMLPGSFTADILEDGGLNPSSTGPATTNFVDFAFGGWSTDVAEPWTAADIIEFVHIDDSGVSGNWQAVHGASTSIDEPFFDAVLLVENNGGIVSICGVYGSPVETDNGVNRFYTYSFDPADFTDTQCDDGNIGTLHAVGVSGSSLLVTAESFAAPS